MFPLLQALLGLLLVLYSSDVIAVFKGGQSQNTRATVTRISWRISKSVLNDGLAGVFKVAVGI